MDDIKHLSDEHLDKGLLDQAYAHLPAALAANFLLSLVLVGALWTSLAPLALLVWLAGVWLISGLRGLLLRAYRLQSETAACHAKWKYLFLSSLFASGVLWGLAPLLVFDDLDRVHQVFVAFVLGGLIAGGTTSLAALPSGRRIFTVLLSAPVAIKFLGIAEPTSVAMGIMGFIFAGTCLAMGRHVHSMLVDSLKLRDENRLEIAERIRAEKEVRRSRDQLELAVHERTAELLETNRNLAAEVAERKATEERLRESEERFRQIFETSTVSIWEEDISEILEKFEEMQKEGRASVLQKIDAQPDFAFDMLRRIRVIDVNQATLELHRVQNKDQLKQSLDRIFTPATLNTIRGLFRSIVTGETHFQAETTYQTLDGEEIIAYVSVPLSGPVFQKGRLLVYVTDITESRRLQKELERSRSIDSLGVLAGGIAHDFNNLMTGIFGNIELARLALDGGHDPRGYLEQAGTALDIARSLSNQLLTFSRGGAPARSAVSLPDLIQSSIMLVLGGSNIRCNVTRAEGVWSVRGDSGQLAQVFHNLLLNAKEAMPSGGTMSISVENVHVEDGQTPHLPAGRYVAVALSDNGPGIAPEHIDKVFEPYFSTKSRGEGRGTGLGLSVCYSVITKHGGRITVQSSSERGTTFHILLPAAPNEAGQESVRPAAANVPAPGARVLLMEDEPHVSRICSDMLTWLGYDVTVAENSEQAVAFYQREMQSQRPFAAVILDLTIRGGIGGKETIGRLRTMDPDVKAVVASGYSEDPVMSNFRDHGFAASIRKPFTIETLKQVMEFVLA